MGAGTAIHGANSFPHLLLNLLTVTTSDSASWQEAIRLLRDQIPPREFGTWFAPVRAGGVRDGVAFLRVPNATFADRLGGKYQPLILEALRTAGADALEVRCEVSSVEPAPRPSTEELLRSEPLSSNCTFENFVVGESNRTAYRAARAVSEPGVSGSPFNPLLIYGDAGLGKTHLLQSIGRRALEAHPRLRMFHTKGEAFTRHVVRVIRSDRLYRFRDQCDELELLLVDDIEFIAGLDRFSRSTKEFFHVLDSMAAKGRQIVVTAKAHPNEIENLDSRVRSRLEAGLTTCLQAPDPATSIELVRRSAERLGLALPAGAAERIGARYNRDGREIAGVLKQLVARQEDSGRVTTETVDRVLCGLPFRRPEPPSIQRIIVATASAFGVPPLRLRDRHRTQDVVLARHAAIFLARQLTGASQVEIGKAFRRDHSTVRYALKRVKHQRKRDAGLDELIRRLVRQLR